MYLPTRSGPHDTPDDGQAFAGRFDNMLHVRRDIGLAIEHGLVAAKLMPLAAAGRTEPE